MHLPTGAPVRGYTPAFDEPDAGPSSDGFSSKGTFLGCEQAWAFWRLLGLVPAREPKARARGSLVHEGLMWRYMKLMGDLRATHVDPVDKMRQMPNRYQHVLSESVDIFRGYEAHWGTESDLHVLAVEREHVIYLDDGRGGQKRHSQRLDLVFEENGSAYIVDHKCHYSTINSAIREWSGAAQMALLHVIGTTLFHLPPPLGYGMKFGGVVLNYCGSSAPHRYGRAHLIIPTTFIKPVMDSMVFAASAREKIVAEGRDPWDYPKRVNNCVTRFGKCDFYELCRTGKAGFSSLEFEVDETIKRKTAA